jgi:hypothetical protein
MAELTALRLLTPTFDYSMARSQSRHGCHIRARPCWPPADRAVVATDFDHQIAVLKIMTMKCGDFGANE